MFTKHFVWNDEFQNNQDDMNVFGTHQESLRGSKSVPGKFPFFLWNNVGLEYMIVIYQSETGELCSEGVGDEMGIFEGRF